MYQRNTNDWAHFRIQNQKIGIAFLQPPVRGRKLRGVQMKKDVYNHALKKYKRLGPFSNPKSEKRVTAYPNPPGRSRKVRGVQTKKKVYNRVQTIEPIFESKIRKRGIACRQLLLLGSGRKVRGVQMKKKRIQSCTNEIQTIKPIFESKIRKGG